MTRPRAPPSIVSERAAHGSKHTAVSRLPPTPTRRCGWWCAAALAATSSVGAQPVGPERVRLTVLRGPGSATCPDRDAVLARLRDRLQRDVVEDESARRVTLRFRRAGHGHDATLQIVDGRRRTVRRLRSAATDCARLGDAATLVVAIAIDPLVATAAPAPVVTAPVVTAPVEPATPAPTPAPVEPVTAPPPTAPTPVLPPAPPSVVTVFPSPWTLSAMVAANLGTAPGTWGPVHLGLALRAVRRWGAWELPLDLGVDLPGTEEDTPRHAVARAVPVRAGVGLCRRVGTTVALSVCAVAGASAVAVWGDGYPADQVAAAFAVDAGVRVGVTVSIAAGWSWVASLDARALLVRPQLRVDGNAGGDLWSAPPLAGSLATGVSWRIP